MREDVNPTSSREFPRRRERARATRRRVLDSALALFVERGYVGTTIGAIAERADVAPETIYSTFGNKRTLLAELVDISIAGDDEAIPILEREWVRTMGQERDTRRRLRILTDQGSSILERRAAVDEVVRGAATADLEIASLHELGKAQRLAGQRAILRIAIGSASLRDELAMDAAADILYAIGSPETYRHLVVDRGWSSQRFKRWFGDTIEHLLLDPGHADRESEGGNDGPTDKAV